MQLPINIDVILNQHIIESDRIEFKKGWNPKAVLHTLCAFANDFHNLGGGYIIIGVEERNGSPVLPPIGINQEEIDNIQKQILFLGHKIKPSYIPRVYPYKMDDKYILVIWAPGGFDRPYKAPKSDFGEDKELRYYVRKNSSTVQASHLEERELMEISRRVPFDDRVNFEATLEDLEFSLIYDFLKKIKSGLLAEADKMPFSQLCKRMNIVHGADESLRPLNIGLLFFNQSPQKFFPQTQIDIVELPDGSGGDLLREKIVTGPIDKMVKDTLSHLKHRIIEEVIIKNDENEEAERIFNVPYPALEEAIVNAVYHRDYQIREPIEVRILPDEITIASYPGPDRSIALEALKTGSFIARCYRNRRIGDFFKELELTEGRGTGIPKILMAMKANGSPAPSFESNEDRTYFVVRLPLHPKTIDKTHLRILAEPEWRFPVNSNEYKILKLLHTGPLSKKELATQLGQSSVTGQLNRIIKLLLEERFIDRTIPKKPQSRLQQYKITKKGNKLIS